MASLQMEQIVLECGPHAFVASGPHPSGPGKTGPRRSSMVPGFHTDLSRPSRTRTLAPTVNCLKRALASRYCFYCACSLHTFSPNTGRIKSNCVRVGLPKSNEAGDFPVIACGVLRYDTRKLCKRCWKGKPFPSPAFMACLKVWTNLSITPFEAGWYGAVRMCRMPLAFTSQQIHVP